jgi:threonine/homoserine/homoserine lactone efflux protein
MLWATIAVGLIGGAFLFWLIYRHLKRAQKGGTDIAY